LALAEAVESQLVSDLSSIHGVGEILLVSKDQEDCITKLVLR
jgi:hypothetical protein